MKPLKNCPFCNAKKASTVNLRLDDCGFCGTAKVWLVHCYGCNARGPVTETKEQAEAAWQKAWAQ